MMGKYLAYIPITIFVTLLASLFISLTITPALFFKSSREKKLFTPNPDAELTLTEDEKLILDIQDDGCGFQKLTGRELHSIRERLSALSGSLEILSSQDPTWIRIELPYGGKEA